MSTPANLRLSSGGFKWYNAPLTALLTGATGPVAHDLAARATRVESQAKLNASGRPGPRVVTGRGRSSITWVLGQDGQGLYADVGTNVNYMAIHELSGRYPWLLRALPAAAR